MFETLKFTNELFKTRFTVWQQVQIEYPFINTNFFKIPQKRNRNLFKISFVLNEIYTEKEKIDILWHTSVVPF